MPLIRECVIMSFAGVSRAKPLRSPSMNDDPSQIADHLVQQHGIDGALEAVREGIAAAHESGDNYRLSVWREVTQALKGIQDAADNQEASAI